jgi:hypothetical protein
MLIRPAIGDTDPIRYRRHTPDGQFSGNIIDEAMRGQNSEPRHTLRRAVVRRRSISNVEVVPEYNSS